MDKFSREDVDARKKAIFEKMSKRGQRRIMKMGFDQWDPFQAPKDPIDIRRDPTRRTAKMLLEDFYNSRSTQDFSLEYGQAILEVALGMVNQEDRARAIFDFCCWYRDLLEKEGHSLD